MEWTEHETRNESFDDIEYLVKLKLLTYNLRLLEARKAKGWTQMELASICGIYYQTLSRIEMLKQIPSLQQAQEIADALELERAWLFPEELGQLRDMRREALLTGEQVKKIGWIRPLALPPPESNGILIGLREELKTQLNTLTTRQAKVLTLRFGLDGGNPRTLEETGRVFGVTRSRIGQIETKALRRLRQPSRSKLLKTYLG